MEKTFVMKLSETIVSWKKEKKTKMAKIVVFGVFTASQYFAKSEIIHVQISEKSSIQMFKMSRPLSEFSESVARSLG